MTLRSFCSILSLVLPFFVHAQPVRLKLPRQINVPNYHHFAPSISADGLTLIFASNYYVTDGNKVDVKLARNKGGDYWSSGEDVAAINKSGEQNLHGAHCLSADANTIYFTSKKMGGVGGFDIWMTEKKGGVYATAQNLGKPINTEGMEGYPSLSPDGKYLFFVRCQSMSNQSCDDCKLMMAEHKGQGIFKEPIAVSNTVGISVIAPKMAKDGKTLTFASKSLAGKGGYDIYLIRKTGDNWSQPENMDFLNSNEDDKYSEYTSQGDALFYSTPTDGFQTLYKARAPSGMQTSKILLFTGKCLNTTKQAIGGFLQIVDNTTGLPISINRIDIDGKFAAVLPSGRSYDISISSGNENYFWSSTYDATNLSVSQKEEPEVILPKLSEGALFHSNKPIFDSTTAQTLPGANFEFKRIAKIMNTHPTNKFEFVLFPSGISNNPPADPEGMFGKMKIAFTEGLSKAGIAPDKITTTNGYNTAEEANSYCGWGMKMLP